MTRPSKKYEKQKVSLAEARAVALSKREQKWKKNSTVILNAEKTELKSPPLPVASVSESPSLLELVALPMTIEDDESECGYGGGVNHVIVSSSDSEAVHTESSEALLSGSITEFGGSDIVVLKKQAGCWSQISAKEWTKAEMNRGLGYNGHSGRSKRRREKDARDQHAFHEQAKTSSDSQISLMRTFFAPRRPTNPIPDTIPLNDRLAVFSPAELSIFNSDEDYDDGCEADNEEDDELHEPPKVPAPSNLLPLKRRRLEVPVRVQEVKRREEKQKA